MEWPKITKDTPLEEIKAIHQRIWDYVIEHGEMPMTSYICNCIACQYDAVANGYYVGDCSKCPIYWGFEKRCDIIRSWSYEKDPEKKLDLARQIRDMPFKYEMEEK